MRKGYIKKEDEGPQKLNAFMTKMVFCWGNSSELQLKKMFLDQNFFGNSRLKAENLRKLLDIFNNFFEQ